MKAATTRRSPGRRLTLGATALVAADAATECIATSVPTGLKAKILGLLDEVAAGEEVEITKHGRTVARLVPASGPHALEGALTSVGVTAVQDDELFTTGATWDMRAVLPVPAWLRALSAQVRTVAITSAIAATTLSLRLKFPGDPEDRLISATAVEHGWELVTKDSRLRNHRHPRPLKVW